MYIQTHTHTHSLSHAQPDALVAFARSQHVDIFVHQLDQPVWIIRAVEDQSMADQYHLAYTSYQHCKLKEIFGPTPTVHTPTQKHETNTTTPDSSLRLLHEGLLDNHGPANIVFEALEEG